MQKNAIDSEPCCNEKKVCLINHLRTWIYFSDCSHWFIKAPNHNRLRLVSLFISGFQTAFFCNVPRNNLILLSNKYLIINFINLIYGK